MEPDPPVTTIYVCGPMSGYEDHNEPAFRLVARSIRADGKIAIVPHDLPAMQHEGSCPRSHTAATTGNHGVACYLRADLAHLLLYCDEVFVLRGWEASVGARLEVQVAAACGIPLRFQS
jgi:hypothetical protein